MIIRRAARFGSKIGLNEPFLAKVSEAVIETYGDFYPELKRHRKAILDNITREEQRFLRTVEAGVAKLDELISRLKTSQNSIIPGEGAFDLYATYGLPLEITRDIAREQGLEVDDAGFHAAMEEHRLASGAGTAFGSMGGEQVDAYRAIFENLLEQGSLEADGVYSDPYSRLEIEAPILALIKNSVSIDSAGAGEKVEIVLPETCFFVESGGQVSDTGTIVSTSQPYWEVRIDDVRKPAAGLVVHIGEVVVGVVSVGEEAIARVDAQRRHDVMRNHTATHLLHHELRLILGEHARQAGSLVAPDRLRFDFTHPEPLSAQQIEQIEAGVNRNILGDYSLKIALKPLQQAIAEGATALFGEKYGETVRNITIGEPEVFSNELCGGTHVESTGDIGIFVITSEGSAAAGIRRIEAVTGRGAYELIQKRLKALKQAAGLLASSPEEVPVKVEVLINELSAARKLAAVLRRDLAMSSFVHHLDDIPSVAGVRVLTAILGDADADTLRQMADIFRQRYPSGIAVLAAIFEGRPTIVASVSEDLVQRGLHAGELVKFVAVPLGGGGGGRPTLAQAGGKDASNLDQALASVKDWVAAKLS
jgi:alanyl-tRNA synthetase